MLTAKRFPSKWPLRPIVVNPPHESKTKHKFLPNEAVISEESDTMYVPHETVGAVMYRLHVPFQWVSAFPRYFHTHPVEEVRKKHKNVWITKSIEEAVAYLNVDKFLLKTNVNDRKERITQQEWPEGVQVLNVQCDIDDLHKAHVSLQNLFSKVIAGESEICKDFFSLCPDSRHNAFLVE
jgi:hypothetical protein